MASLSELFSKNCMLLKVPLLLKLERKQKESNFKPHNALEELNEKNDSLIEELRSPFNKELNFRLPGPQEFLTGHWNALWLSLPSALEIRDFHISNCRIHDFKKLCATLQSLRNLRNLEFFACELIDADISYLTQFIAFSDTLCSLKLSDNQIEEAVTDLVKACEDLTILHLGGNPIARHMRDIFDNLVNSKIESLGLRNIGLQDLSGVTEMLENSKCRIEDLELRKNNLHSQMLELAVALHANQSLKVLELEETELIAQDLVQFNLAYQGSSSLHAISLSQNELTDVAVDALADIIRKSFELTTIQLDECNLTSHGITRLILKMHADGQGVSLSGISLSKNKIDDIGFLALASVAAMGQLTSINVSFNKISASGIVNAMQKFSDSSCRIRHLDLSGNLVQDEGAVSIANFLMQNQTLERLFLTDCAIKEMGLNVLAAAMESNYALEEMSYGGQGKQGNAISKDVKTRIDARLKDNLRRAKEVQLVEFNESREMARSLGDLENFELNFASATEGSQFDSMQNERVFSYNFPEFSPAFSKIDPLSFYTDLSQEIEASSETSEVRVRQRGASGRFKLSDTLG